FEVNHIAIHWDKIEEILVKSGVAPAEQVRISQSRPRAEYCMTVEDVYERRLRKCNRRRNPWRVT
ncbi:MAG: hypothetical protein ACRD1Z_05315, partial [Vicinamibacteria bacterium]